MKRFLNSRICLIMLAVADALIVPLLVAAKRLSGYMLTQDHTCVWMRFGGRCVTCGGTHFVYALASGRLDIAFISNPFLFFLTLYAVIVYIFVHIDVFLHPRWCSRVLKSLVSVKALIVFACCMLVFLVLRNLPLIIAVFQLIFHG